MVKDVMPGGKYQLGPPALGLEQAGAKGVVLATETLRDTLIRELSNSSQVVKAGGKLNLNLVDEANQFVQFLKQVKNPTLQEMNKGLEILKLQGRNVKPIADQVIKAAQTSFQQLRDHLGRWSGATAKTTIAGKTMSLDFMHSAEGTKFFQSLSRADQEKFAEFDRVQSRALMKK